MKALLEVNIKQRAVNEILVAEKETPVNIYTRLQTIYQDETLTYTAMRGE